MLWSDGVTATVSNTQVTQGDSIQLFIKATGDDPQFPQIDKIGNAFIQGSSNRSSRNMTMINGSFTSEVSTTLIFQFAPTKTMTIPAYRVEIDGIFYKTKPITINVAKAKKHKATAKEPYFILMQSNKKTLTVGETAILTTILSVSNNSAVRELGEYNAPNSNDFFIKELGELKKYTQGNNQIFERRYSITAKQEANTTLESISAKIGFENRERRNFFGLSVGTKWKKIYSNEIKIKILAPSQESDIIGDFTVQTTIDAQEVKANKPVNLSIKIQGKGNLENFEFPKYEIDGVMVYSDDAKIETKIVGDEIVSTYTKSFALISENSFSIPARSFSMLSLKDKKLKSLDIKSFDIKIKIPKTSHTTMPKTTGIVQSKQIPQVISKEKIIEKTVEVQSIAWWMLVLAFIAGVITLLAIQMLNNIKKSPRPYKESEALKILYAHISEGKEIEEMVRKLYARKNGDKSIEIDKKLLKEMVERFVS